MKKFNYVVFISFFLINLSQFSHAQSLCLESICIGDDVDSLDVEWKKIKLDYKIKRSVKHLLAEKTVNDIYYDYNETLMTSQKTLEELIPYIITLQKFDQTVLDRLAKVKAICTPLTLTGEVVNNSKTKLLVTFKVVADEGRRGRLRVVQVEKEFNIYPPHLRPADEENYVAMLDVLKQDFPKLYQQRDIDARAETNEGAFATAIVGFRFYSDINSPLVFRVRDIADIESIDYDPKRSASCPVLE